MNPGKMLMLAGAALIVAGGAWMVLDRMGVRLGSLPGDVSVRGERGGFYFPIVTCLLFSAVLTAVMWIVGRMRGQ